MLALGSVSVPSAYALVRRRMNGTLLSKGSLPEAGEHVPQLGVSCYIYILGFEFRV